MTGGAARFAQFHRVAVATVRLLASDDWALDEGRRIEAALRAALLAWDPDDALAAEAGALLRRLDRRDYFSPHVTTDRWPLLEAVLALREQLLMQQVRDHEAPAGTWFDSGPFDPVPPGTEDFGAAVAHALRRLYRENAALDRHAIVSVTDAAGTITDVNRMFCEISGYRRDELIGATHGLLKSGRHGAAFYEEMWRTIRAGRIWSGEICNRAKSGALYWVQSTIVPVGGQDGAPAEYVSVRTDITTLKETEERLRLLERAVLAGTSGVVIADALHPGCPISYLSPSLGRLFGATSALMLGQPLHLLLERRVGADEAQRLCEAAFRGEAPLVLAFEGERADGERFHAELRLAPVETDDGVRSHFVGIATDTTELRRAKEAAERADRAKSVFLSNISHELRTPLNAVLGFAQLLPMRVPLPPLGQEYVEQIDRAGKHLLALIGDVLDLAHIESGDIGVSIVALDVREAMFAAVELLTPAAQQRGMTVEVLAPPGLRVLADATRLRQVLSNLLSNAIKYHPGGGRVLLGAELRAAQGRVRLSVTDDGPGIAEEKLGQLFQPFNRLGAERSATEGTGLGLAITRRLVEAMGGRIDVESIVGIGTSFAVTLPWGGATDQPPPG